MASGSDASVPVTFFMSPDGKPVSKIITVPGPAGADGIPGVSGVPGRDGEQGEQGVPGQQGEQGIPGAPGATGETGATGLQGVPGVKGDTGDKGDTGATGLQGSTGSPGAAGSNGAQGLKGDQGEQGEQGVPGVKGNTGDAGASLDIAGDVETYADLPSTAAPGAAYVVLSEGLLYFWNGTAWPADGSGVPFQGPQGQDGQQGIQGVKGDPGATGQTGADGAPGTTGADGAKGDTGATGDPGATGQTGQQGEQGIPGVKGDAGTPGVKGDQGIPGTPGSTGQTGAPCSLQIGTVIGGGGVTATVTGTAPNQLLNLTFPAPAPLGGRCPLDIVTTVTDLGNAATAGTPHGTTIDGGVVQLTALNPNLSPAGGATLLQDVHDVSGLGYCYQWRTDVPNLGVPSPRSWSVGFEVYGTDEVEFIVNAYPSYFNLTVDGDRVFYTSQVGPQPVAAAGETSEVTSIKFKFPDVGKYDLRFYMSDMSLERVCTGPGGWIIPKPVSGPRCYFLGDRCTAGFTGQNFDEISGWPYWFANLSGIVDVWNDGQPSTGPTTGGGSNSRTYVKRATATLVPANPDIVFIQGYEQDKIANVAPAAIAAGVSSAIDIARTAAKNPYIVIIGSPEYSGTVTSQDIAIAGAIHTVCFAKGVAWIDPDSGEVWNAAGQLVKQPDGPWITTINQPTFVTGLNTDGTVIPSLTSLNELGQSYFGYKVWEAVQLLNIPAMNGEQALVVMDVGDSV